MHRSRLVTLLGGALLAAFLLPSVALAGTPAANAATVTPVTPNITMHCARIIPAGRPAHDRVVCRWTAVTGVDVRAYRLYRFVDGPLHARQLVARVTPDKPLRGVDWHISDGHHYTYRVVAIGTDGKRVGESNFVGLRVGRPAQALGLKCVFLVDGAKEGVACHWNAATNRPGTMKYVLFRSVDGGAWQWLHRTGKHGHRYFLDTKVTAGQTIRYKVFAVAGDGRVVGIGRDSIVVPTVVTPTAS
ncbi:MAG TPA: hypothetical protein VGM28_08930 [Candidatus Limnocylindrales bacterium]|jgi:hypothetical protein